MWGGSVQQHTHTHTQSSALWSTEIMYAEISTVWIEDFVAREGKNYFISPFFPCYGLRHCKKSFPYLLNSPLIFPLFKINICFLYLINTFTVWNWYISMLRSQCFNGTNCIWILFISHSFLSEYFIVMLPFNILLSKSVPFSQRIFCYWLLPEL